jgi:hypothetical protein
MGEAAFDAAQEPLLHHEKCPTTVVATLHARHAMLLPTQSTSELWMRSASVVLPPA